MTTRIYIWVIAIIISIYALSSTFDVINNGPSSLGLIITGGVLVTAWFLSNQIRGGGKSKKSKIINRSRTIIHKKKRNINASDIWTGVALIVVGLLWYSYAWGSSGGQPSIFVLTPALIGVYLIYQAFVSSPSKDSKDSDKASTGRDEHKID